MSRRPLRVHFLGNTCNNHFLLARFLRARGVDAHLFYDERHHFQTLPESEDPGVADARPDWLHPYGAVEAGPTPWVRPSAALERAIADCDILHVEDVGLVWAAATGRPYLWYPYGFDLNKYAFASHWRSSWDPRAPDRYLASVRYRRAIAGADEVLCGLWYQPLAHGWSLIGDLLPPERFTHDIQLALDTDRFRPLPPGTDGAASLQRLLDDASVPVRVEGLRLFQPARVMFSEDSYVNKANDRFFRALARFRADGGAFTLVLIRRGLPDERIAQSLFTSLGIADRVAWVDAMPRHALVPWYQASEIVADEFIGGTLGSVSFEALATGNALLTRLALHDDDPTYWPPTHTFPDLPPVLNATDEDGILARLDDARRDPAGLQAARERSRSWAETWVAGDRVAARLEAVYARILARRATGTQPTARATAGVASSSADPEALLASARGRTLSGRLDAVARALDVAPASPAVRVFLAESLERDGHVAAAAVVREESDTDGCRVAAPDRSAPPSRSVAARPRLLAIADTPGWIFERHVHALAARLGDRFEIDLAFRGEPFDESAYALVYPLEYDLVPPEAIERPSKYVTGLRSHVAWDGLPPALLGRYLTRHFQRVHVVSRRLHGLLDGHVPELEVVAHGFDARQFRPVDRAGRDGQPLRVGWAGNPRSPVKGFDTLIAPLETVDGIVLSRRTHGARQLGEAEMPAYYATLDVYVCASSSEGHNNSVLEAAATGCAIVTTDVGTVPEYLVDGESALVVPRERSAIEAAVRRLRDDAPLRRRLGDAAARVVHAQWSWDTQAARYRAFFERALAASAADADGAAAQHAARGAHRARRRDAIVQALEAVQRAVARGDSRAAHAAATRLVTIDPTDPTHRALYREFAPEADDPARRAA